MKFDLTFPTYAARMTRFLHVFLIVGTGILFAWKGWTYGAAWALGTLFHILFYKLMVVKFNQWVKAEREPEFIGQHLFIFTTMRFILEILCALAVVFSPLDILAFLGGLLTLPVATLAERVVGLIKE